MIEATSTHSERPRTWIAYLVAAVALLLFAATAIYLDRLGYAKDELRFQNVVEHAETLIRNRLNTYVAMLRAGTGLFAADEHVTGEQFHAYVDRLDLANNYPGIQGIGFSRRLSSQEVDELVAHKRAAGDVGFRVWPEHPRDEYHAIVYLEPLDRRNQAAIGYDMFTESTRQVAMTRARDEGLPAASGRVTLVQEIDEDKQAGFLIYVPVYSGGDIPATLEERRAQLLGFVYSPFRCDDLLNGIFAGETNPRVKFEVYDGTSVAANELLHRSHALPAGFRPRFTAMQTLNVAGQPWTLVFKTRPEFELSSAGGMAPYMLAGGIGVSFVLLLVLRAQILARARAEKTARDLQQSRMALGLSSARLQMLLEQSPLSIQIFSPDGTLRDANAAWEQLWESTREQLAGYNILQDHQLEAKGVMPYIRRAFAGEAAAIPAIYYDPAEAPRKGRPRWVEAFIYPIRDESGTVLEVALILQDVTDRKQAEEAVRRSEERYRSLVSATSQVIWTTNAAGDVIEDLPTWRDFTGQSVEQMMGRGWSSVVHPDDRERVGKVWADSLAKGTSHENEFRVKAADGTWRHVLARAAPVFQPDGRVREWIGTCTDITLHKHAERALRESEHRFRTMADTAPVLIWMCGPHNEGTWFNKLWLDFVGRSLEEELGPGWAENIHPDDREQCVATCSAAIADRRAFTMEFRLRRHDGEYRWVLDSGVPRLAPDGSLEGYIGSCVDITERKEAEEALRDARDAAEAANRLKDEFLATVSHELRTPLNAILGWAQLLRITNMNGADLSQGLETIERSAKSQAALIEDLLDVSRIITGKLRLDVRPIALPAVIEAALETVRPAAEAKGVRLRCELDHAGGSVNGDPHRLQQVVWNLLSNAIKFTPRDGSVSVRLARQDEQIVLSVHDTGQGIDPEFLPYVFNAFRQADGSITRKHGGLGLGLAIVRHLVELHGGTVQAHSDGPDRGAVFTVTLPVAAPMSTDDVTFPVEAVVWEERSAPAAASLQGVRVLVVDDEPDARELLRRMLRECRAHVTAAASAREAMEAIRHEVPHVILSDIGMPEEDGYELIRKIRALPADHGGHTPAVALTAFARMEDRRRAMLAGYQMHLSKPVEPAELVTVIASLAGRINQETRVHRRAVESAEDKE